MSTELKNKFIKCEPGINHSTFTFIGVNTEWEPESKIKALNDFTVINITKWKILKYKESMAKEEKTNEKQTSQSTQQTHQTQPNQHTEQVQIIQNNIKNLTEQELAELIFNNPQEAEQEKEIIKEFQQQKIQNQNKQETNNSDNTSFTSPPKDKDEPSLNLSSQFEVSISTQEINTMLNTDFIFDDSSPIPNKLLELISPEPIVFSIRELDSPTKDNILNELLYQPEQSIYVPPPPPSSPSTPIKQTKQTNKNKW
ncbi:hypothetical protein DDB_G0294178 [Dictyostelium discoideum AX4]|uniref:Uncharacterized protein n=1 Tax=Dictyostelium discoideum TaxID=44689 RepID=Q54AV6_DICDI|nr:hypothetical protein DDB_G0294178 [Dictyostelium discoideum AX4]EAL60395.1 hypothetical protein DDB_G0294178 [Dictyostelium discoideum AX4]|eukprot:XP_628808.1 hypothetical protein DDB_G0294178 [Dictyostelium discoideum AX4]